MLSAAPVGRLVLAVFEVLTPERVELSDRVCIALQVVEHLQAIGEDARRGRVYMPAADMDQVGCTEDDLLAANASAPLQNLVALEARRARDLLKRALPLAATLRLGPRAAVAGRAGNDVLATRCRPGKAAFAGHALSGFFRASFKRGGS